MMNKNLLRICGVVLGAFVWGACGQIPSNYRGEFVDPASGARLNLGGSKGSFKTPDGRTIHSKSETPELENLLEGKPGIYGRINEKDENILELYWINPNRGSKKEAADFRWYETEVIYSRLDLREEQDVDVFRVVHSKDGTLLLDKTNSVWQIGWPSSADILDLRRVAD